jgi:hypothetical protein
MNISGYIPSRNRTQVAFPERSFEEMALGPSLLMKREEEQNKSIADIGTDISNNSYYLDADDKNVAPIVESLQKEADDLANEAATKGYDPMLSNKLIAFRRKYQKALSQNEPWGRAIANYKDATAQWKQWDEAHKNDPQEFKQKAKKYFFGQYQGAVDDETPGQLRRFEAGAMPNYYDVNRDIREALKDATGKIGKFAGSEGSSISIDMSSGTPMLKVFNSNLGQYMDNLQPLLAGAQALIDDFSGAYGADTDRARFAKVQGITPEYLANTVGNITKSQRDSYYSQLPSSNGSYQSIPQEGIRSSIKKQGSTGGIAFPSISEVKNNPKLQKVINKENEIMSGSFSGGKFDPVAGRKAIEDREKELGPLANFKPDNIWRDIKTSFIGDRTNDKFAEPQKVWDKYIKEFEPLYNTYKAGKLVVGGKPITTDEQWYNYANQIKQNNASFLDSKTNLSNPELYRNLNTQVYVPKSGKLFKSMEDDEELNWKDFKERYKDNGWDVENMTSWMDSDGKTIVQVPGKNGETKDFRIDGIPDQTTNELKQTMRDVKAIFTDYIWTPQEIAEQNKPNVALPVSDNLKLKVYVDPQNPANKYMYFIGKFPVLDNQGNDTGEVEWRTSSEPATKSELQQIATFGENTILSTKFK